MPLAVKREDYLVMIILSHLYYWWLGTVEGIVTMLLSLQNYILLCTTLLFQVFLCRSELNQYDSVYPKTYLQSAAICQCKLFFFLFSLNFTTKWERLHSLFLKTSEQYTSIEFNLQTRQLKHLFPDSWSGEPPVKFIRAVSLFFFGQRYFQGQYT